MRIGLVIDSPCDLPAAKLEEHGIRVLPSVLELGGKAWVDDRDAEQTMHFYRRYIADRTVPARSTACSGAEIQEMFLRDLVLDYERVLVITAGAEYSETWQRATEASYAILQGYRTQREQAGQVGGFALRVLDSGSVCAGEAVLLLRALHLLEVDHLAFDRMRRSLRDESGRIHCLLVAGDPWYLRKRGLRGERGDLGPLAYARAWASGLKPVLELAAGRRRVVAWRSGFASACATAMGRARKAIRAGLGSPALALSFGGDPRVIRKMPAYRDLEASAISARVDLHLAVMSAAMGARLGPGAFSIAWLARPEARAARG